MSTVANGKSRIDVKNGGVFCHNTYYKLSASKKPLSLGGRGTTVVSVTDGGLFEDAHDFSFGDGADNYAGDSEIAITNGTFRCTGAITIGRDTRCQANYKVTVAGEDGLLDAKSSLTLGATSYLGAKNRTAGSATLLVDGGMVRVAGTLNVGAQYERVTDTLKLAGETAKLTANSLSCTTNAVIRFVVPENGFTNAPVVEVTANAVLASEQPTPILIDATDCASSSRWQTLIASTTGEIRNLTLDQVEVTTARNKLSKLRLVQDDDDKVTALEFRLQDASGTTIIIL